MSVKTTLPFTPITATDKRIKDEEIHNGCLYFATDTGKMYLDTENQRISVGGSVGGGASIYYGNVEEPVYDEDNEEYTFSKNDVGNAILEVGDLILNIDGGFYKVKTIAEDNYICTLLTVSGNGAGPSTSATRPTISFTINNTNLINGQKAYFTVEGTSALEADGKTPIDTDLYVTYTLGTKISDTVVNNYHQATLKQVTTNGHFITEIEFGSYVKPSANSVLKVYVWGGNHEAPSGSRGAEISSSELKLSQLSSYSPTTRYPVSGFSLNCNVLGAVDKILKCYFDDKLFETKTISHNTSNSNPSFNIPAGRYLEDGTPVWGTATHGCHTVRIELCQKLADGSEGLSVEPLKYEIAVAENNASAKPIIWLGDHKSVYYTYDTIKIPFLVWDPSNTTLVKAHLYKNGIEQDGSPREITKFSEFYQWEIADADFGRLNTYKISCGETEDRYVEREIQFEIEVDPTRLDFEIAPGDLKLNFTAAGRSNSEPAGKRQTWTYDLNGVQKQVIFKDFNWENNGWDMDEDINTSFIRISNGAELTIPFQPMTFASGESDKQSHTVEMQFKISNIQKYGNLIKNITRYKNDENYYLAFKEKEKAGLYDNYDVYLQKELPADIYEKLTDSENFDKVQKLISVNNIVAGLYDINGSNVTGFCVGPQDAFFSNGTDTVNVNFVENELINISFIYQHSLKQLYIYINGVITGVIKSSIEDGVTFDIKNPNFVFNSRYCDIDLYKLRIYQTDLNVNQIITNYAVDYKNVDLFDQRVLAQENLVLGEYQLSYDQVEKFNDNHPQTPLMPYIIFDTGNINSKLPYSKDDTKAISVEFVNKPLELAYSSGRLEKLAREDGLISQNETDSKKIADAVKLYYKHHCPSFTTTLRSTDKVNFEVQGTSSQFYPRRNYKIKTKMKGMFNWKDNEDLEEGKRTEDGGAYTEEEALNLFMHMGPYAEDYIKDQNDVAEDIKKIGYERTRLTDGWYMNNYTNPTDRWTMKVDYMESSGSYNAGFASLIGNGYTKHPIQDYIRKGVINEKSKLKPVAPTTITDQEGMRWQDFRTSLLGFPVMAFWKRGSGENTIYTFIGYYRMLLDKSSTQVLGFKTPKKVTHKLFPIVKDGKTSYKALRDVAECWEFSNNARGFCSYRDRWKRVELSFKAPEGLDDKDAYTAKGAPIVADDFEYRYHALDDAIDVLYDFDKATQAELDAAAADLGLPSGSIMADNRVSGANALLTTHENWEKVCKWVYSTDPEAVASQGIYTPAPVGNVEYKDDGTFFVIDENNEYKASTEPFDLNKIYYKINTGDDKETVPYIQVDAALPEFVFEKGKFYYLASGYNTPNDNSDDVYALSYDDYDGSITYYTFNDSDLADFDNRFDLLVRKTNPSIEVFEPQGPMMQASMRHTYNPARTYYTKNGDNYSVWTYAEDQYISALKAGLYFRDKYYTWHGTDYDVNDPSKRVVIKKGSATGAVKVVTNPNAADFAAGKYYVFNPTIYANKEYTHDSREYRAAKFTNEFEKHFDPEYVATYFIMTEVMECYDSRGKNCMMASWGPQEEGGDYIWYPIFYDIDTQLGINNTGIPSFEYNVDATEAGNYSTSDSILWNNFYKFFKKTWMLPKYQNLRGFNSKFDTLYEADGTTKKSPLQSVDYIEKWYTFDPEVTNNIACEGIRPLIATNLDMYFKYITITNENAYEQGVAHLTDAGVYAEEPDPGTYFYALQGDRSQSRRQFITSRLEYIDSWLNQGNYARGGANRLWGRISANNNVLPDVHSDKWVENKADNKFYWKDDIEFGEKTHEFDAEYWLEPTPIRSSYFTAGDDSANYPSQKYDGVNPIKFKLSAIENGIRTSSNYPEQLLYIYGTNQMSDFGDLSKMYWTEFKLEGKADKLTRLKLGHDGTVMDYANDNATEPTKIKWYNKKLNGITLPNLPLLKEANFCNINLLNATSLDFSASEKLENFRATGSGNITSIKFADGVALNTLYIPATLSSLSLVQANLLTNLIFPENSTNELGVNQSRYTTPIENEAGNLVSAPGLYLEGFFADGQETSLNSVNFAGGNLGYNSYIVLQRLFDKYNNEGEARITMTDVKWCPYTKLTEGDVYNPNLAYYKDNGHYGFVSYNLINKISSNAIYDINRTYYIKDIEKNTYSIYSGGALGYDAAVINGLYGYDEKQFNADVLSGIVYLDNGHGGRNADGSFSKIITNINDSSIEMLRILASEDSAFRNFVGQKKPELTGLIYVHNSVTVDEDDVIELQQLYPNLTFFFAKVNAAYSAKFMIFDPETYAETYVKWANGSTSPAVQKIQTYSESEYFGDPFELYKPEKMHYDFVGWSLGNRHPYDEEGNLLDSVIIDSEGWKTQHLIQNQSDYIYYAIFELHKYRIQCYNNNDPAYGDKTDKFGKKYHEIRIEYGQTMHTDGIPLPLAKDEIDLELRNVFVGWTMNANNGKIYDKNADLTEILVDFSKYTVIQDYPLYAVYKTESVYDAIVDYDYLNIQNGAISVKQNYRTSLGGKITLPAKDHNGNYITAIDANGFSEMPYLTHVFFEADSKYEIVKNRAFYCQQTDPALVAVMLPDTVREIQDFAFFGQIYLQRVNLNDEIYAIRSQAFENCKSLQLSNLPNKLTALGERTFYGCSALTIADSENNRAIPSGITDIPQRCFAECPKIRVTIFGNKENDDTYQLHSIGQRAFYSSGKNVTAIHLYKTVNSLGADCFLNYGNDGRGQVTVYLPSIDHISTDGTGLGEAITE